MNGITLYVLIVVFFATVIRSTFGFGEALVSVPLLALRIRLDVAAPLAVLLSVTIAAIIVAQDWRKIHVRSARGLLIATLFGMPLGVWWLAAGNERATKAVLGVIILLFSLYALSGRWKMKLAGDSRPWMFVCGFFAGMLGGVYGMNGPPLVIYGSMRGWSAQHFRATLQGYFLPASAIVMAAYWYAGLWNAAVTRYYLMSLPLVLLAIVLGRMMNHRLREDTFLKLVHAGLVGIGLLLLVQTSPH